MYPFASVPVSSIDDYAVDAKRERLYLASEGGVIVLSTAPLATQPLIAMPGNVVALDLTPSGDSLIALLDDGLLGIADLTTDPSAVDTIRLSGLHGRVGTGMRVTAADHAIVSAGGLLYARTDSTVLDVDLGNRVQRLRDVSAWPPNVVRSADRSLLLAWSGIKLSTYDVASDRFGPIIPISFTYEGVGEHPAIDSAGNAILISDSLLSRSLSLTRSLPPTCQYWCARTLSPDGRIAYYGSRLPSAQGADNGPGYRRIDAQSGALLETGFLPWLPELIIPLLDGKRVVVFRDNWAGLVDFSAPLASTNRIATGVHRWELKGLSPTRVVNVQTSWLSPATPSAFPIAVSGTATGRPIRLTWRLLRVQ